MSPSPPRCSAAVAGCLFRRHHHASPLPIAYGATPQSPPPIPLHRDTAMLTSARLRLTLALGFGSAAGDGPAPSPLRLLPSDTWDSSTSSTTSTTTSRASAPASEGGLQRYDKEKMTMEEQKRYPRRPVWRRLKAVATLQSNSRGPRHHGRHVLKPAGEKMTRRGLMKQRFGAAGLVLSRPDRTVTPGLGLCIFLQLDLRKC